ncbi:MAG: hypothetical protein LBM96_05200 [Methanobrevibacter sp.]|nr:hypothetical protein [Candidatus Methanoflexus mossambicus]
MANRGTKEGTDEEVAFVKKLNQKQSDLWKILNLDFKTHFAVHVKTQQKGKISKYKVFPKADIFIAKGKIDNHILEKIDYYVDDTQIEKYDLTPITKTGISVKLSDSKSYTIQKFTPTTFKKIFDNYELGAGASLYSKNEKDFNKNFKVIEGWNTDLNNVLSFFLNKGLEISKNQKDFNLNDAKLIKKYAIKKISNIIQTDENISNFVFQGIGNFEEPYTAHYLFEKGELKNSCKIPFSVTTGSGRSRGDFTIVLKPK